MEITTIAKDLILGEGSLWDEIRNAVHYIDIEGFKVFTYYIETEEIKAYDIKDYVGCVILDKDNNLIACSRNKLLKIDLETGELTEVCTVEQPAHLRFNDGKCDAYGNLWIGSMPIEITEENQWTGKLFCVKNGEVVAEHDGFAIPNGLAWTEDKKTFYHVDTTTQNVFAYDVEDEYVLKNKRIVISVDKEVGSPDGMAIDSQGNLWVAMWGGYKVICFDPKTGEKLDEIKMEDEKISCCAFTGDKLSTMYITSAEGKTKGGIYKVEMKNVTGTLPYKYN